MIFLHERKSFQFLYNAFLLFRAFYNIDKNAFHAATCSLKSTMSHAPIIKISAKAVIQSNVFERELTKNGSFDIGEVNVAEL